MKIGVIGWGSLVWDPRDLALATGEWHADGPLMPVEFARISEDGRLTLVIHPGAPLQTTLWKESALNDLGAVRENLRIREGCHLLHRIHAVDRQWQLLGVCIDGQAANAVRAWLDQHPELDAVVWTGLSSNWREKRGREYSVDDGLAYLKSLRDQWQLAADYIAKAPQQVRTRLRARVEAELG
jgi:hypothetical protein